VEQSKRRYVKKGSKAFYIILPFIKKYEQDNEEKLVLRGFGTKPVFRVEDTDGEPLEYEKLEVPDLPLIERANQWGISVKAVPGNLHYCGYYAPGQKEIAIATIEQCVFFHELSHYAHHIIKGDLQPGQDFLQEIVAESSAQALARMVGKSAENTIGNSYRYIQKYAEKLKLDAHDACLKVISDTEKVLNKRKIPALFLSTAENHNSNSRIGTRMVNIVWNQVCEAAVEDVKTPHSARHVMARYIMKKPKRSSPSTAVGS